MNVGKRRRLLVPLVSMGAIAVGGSPAEAHEFEGECTARAVARFAPPITLVPASRDQELSGAGDCRGRLDGGGQATHPFVFDAAVDGVTGCVTELGRARVVVRFTRGTGPRGDDVLFRLRAHVVTPFAALVRGSRGGVAAATIVPAGDVDPTACATDGLSEIPVEMRLVTITPLATR